MSVDLARLRLRHVRHVVLDMDGTLYRGSQLFACTRPFLARLYDLGIPYTFLTNNTSHSKTDYIAKLARLGITATPEQMYTAADATFSYLREHSPPTKRIALLGTPSLAAQFAAEGFTEDWDAPEAVVVAFDTDLRYDRLCRIAYFIAQGLPFLATHPDFVCPTDEPTVRVDCGAICACLTAATGRKPLVLGKPEPSLLHDICRRANVAPEETVLVGDRLYTDIAMGRRAGACTALVLSGEATEADVAACAPEERPDMVLTDVGELGERLAEARRPAE